MNKKNFFYLIAVLAICTIFACGNSGSSDKTPPSQEDITITEDMDTNKDDGGLSSIDEDEDDEVEVQTTTKSNTNWDTVLKDYETFIDKYIALMKKVQKGDTSALSESATMMENATELADELSRAYGELTPSQVSKLQKLQTKWVNAIANVD
ncbi:MAG: hypothetical protein LBU83_12375 [Bacteroidales bacterium]|jgi:hypothetical protein|nr:hypothetical protein [Bacteroidales bacterium]